jgi:VAD1 Analog of StAR-related lipid transfer domain/GRAM domain
MAEFNTNSSVSFSRVVSTDSTNSALSSAALSRASSMPGGDVTAWLREKFPELAANDCCDASYACALVRGILLQGRLYVTSTGLAFYAKIFGRVTKEFIPYSQVKAVRKRGGGFVANAIKVEFMEEGVPPVVFGSLTRRERALALISVKLRAANPMAASAGDTEEDSSGTDAEEYGEEGFRSRSVPSNVAAGSSRRMRYDDGDAEEGVADRVLEAAAASGRKRATELLDRANTYTGVVTSSRGSTSGDSSGDGGLLLPPAGSLPTVCSSGVPGVDKIAPVKDASAGEVAVPVGVWKGNGDVVDRRAGNAYDAKVEQGRRTLLAPVRTVFNELFIGSWILDVHGKNGNTDLTETPWTRGDGGFMTRQLCFSRALGYRIGPKSTRVVETHFYSFTSSGGVLVECSGHNLDVPMGDSFRVETYIEMEPVAGGSSTSVTASVALHFTKSTMLRSKIESGALEQTKVSLTRLLDLAELRVNESKAEAAPAIAVNGRSDSSLNKRNSANLERFCAVAPVSPVKKCRPGSAAESPLILPSSTGDSVHPSPLALSLRAGLSGLSPSAAASPVSSSMIGPVVIAEPRDTKLLRLTTVVLLGLIALLLACCLVLLTRLQLDVLRLERLAAARLETAMSAMSADGKASLCSPMQDALNH